MFDDESGPLVRHELEGFGAAIERLTERAHSGTDIAYVSLVERSHDVAGRTSESQVARFDWDLASHPNAVGIGGDDTATLIETFEAWSETRMLDNASAGVECEYRMKVCGPGGRRTHDTLTVRAIPNELPPAADHLGLVDDVPIDAGPDVMDDAMRRVDVLTGFPTLAAANAYVRVILTTSATAMRNVGIAYKDAFALQRSIIADQRATQAATAKHVEALTAAILEMQTANLAARERELEGKESLLERTNLVDTALSRLSDTVNGYMSLRAGVPPAIAAALQNEEVRAQLSTPEAAGLLQMLADQPELMKVVPRILEEALLGPANTAGPPDDINSLPFAAE